MAEVDGDETIAFSIPDLFALLQHIGAPGVDADEARVAAAMIVLAVEANAGPRLDVDSILSVAQKMHAEPDGGRALWDSLRSGRN